MLEVDHLSVSFLRYAGLLRRGRVTCLEDVSVTVGPGELLGVIGGSGAGKSLLAQAILGLLPRNAEPGGTMRLDGAPLTPERLAALRGRRIALVPQSIACLDPLARTGRQVVWAARRAGIRGDATAAAERALARVGLDPEVARAFPHELSGGMARRVLMAVATIGAADLLIVDEPTTGLDPANVASVMSRLRTIADEGRAVLAISHDLPALVAVADRVTVLRDGVSVETAPAAAFAGTAPGLRTAYARALWNALPQNGFQTTAVRAAA